MTSYGADALVIHSGSLVRIAAGDADATWCVMGRGSGGEQIAVARAGRFANVRLEDLLGYNAQYLVGQKVTRRGEQWLVEDGEGLDVLIDAGLRGCARACSCGRRRDRAALRVRTVILVDKG